MSLRVSNVIYLYMFICVALLLFNVLYIVSSKSRNCAQRRKTDRWADVLIGTWEELSQTGRLPEHHQAMLERRLKNIDQLIAYHDALSPHLGEEYARRYLSECRSSFLFLAQVYGKRPAMDRAFFAYVAGRCCTATDEKSDRLAELLLGYFQDSTVYCRENVLQALCAIGSATGVMHAFQWFSDHTTYHNAKLLSDGLTTFNGDREALAWRLWSSCSAWSEDLQVAVVQYASQLSSTFSQSFREALESSDTPLEVRFALCRYFQRYPDPAVYPFLLDRAGSGDAAGDGLAVAACTALSRYPGPETMAALERAIHSRNWYVRKNAAESLVALGIGDNEIEAVYAQGDRYASEILNYTLERAGRKEVAV